jgi:hypothetical protein
VTQVRDALIRGCKPRTKDGVFLKFAGNNSRNITLLANDLSGVAKPAEVASDAAKDALVIK